MLTFLMLLALSGCGVSVQAAPAPTLARAAQVAMDWQVYQAAISALDLQPAGGPVLLREPTSDNDCLPIDLAQHSKALLRDIQVRFASTLEPATLIDFRDRNQSDTVAASDFPAQPGLVFLDSEDFDLLAGEDGTLQAALQTRYPGARGPVAFSFVGYNASHDQALLYARHPISSSNEESDYLLLKESAGVWQVIQRVQK